MKTEMVIAVAALAVGCAALAFVVLTQTGGAETKAVVSGGLEETVARLEHELKSLKNLQLTKTTSLEDRIDQLEQNLADIRKALEESKRPPKSAAKQNEPLKPGRLTPTLPPSVEPKPPTDRPIPATGQNPGQSDSRLQPLRRLIERMGWYQERRLRRFAQKHNWDEEKREQVAAVLKEQQEQMRNLLNDIAPNTDRRTITEQLRQLMEQTNQKLQALMTEEEWREFRRSVLPRRSPFRPPFRPRR